MIIDVSEHNGKLDWNKIKPEIEGAIIRAGFGSDYTKQDDAYFERNCSECERLGIPYGVYIYSYANTVVKAKSEANHVKRLVEGKKLSFPIFYDLEEEKYSSYGSKMANTWLEAMEGFDVGIYANVNWWKNYLTGVSCDKKWVAYWGKTKPSISGMVLWQYSDNGKVAGVGGFDLNENISLPIPTPGPEPTPTPTPTPTPIEKYYTVSTKSGLNLRAAPTTSSAKVGYMGNGTTFLAREEAEGETIGGDNVWLKTYHNGPEGWCSRRYCVEASSVKYTVIAVHGLNVRRSPSIYAQVLYVLSYGAKVTVYETKDGWGRIAPNAWVCMKYLK